VIVQTVIAVVEIPAAREIVAAIVLKLFVEI